MTLKKKVKDSNERMLKEHFHTFLRSQSKNRNQMKDDNSIPNVFDEKFATSQKLINSQKCHLLKIILYSRKKYFNKLQPNMNKIE